LELVDIAQLRVLDNKRRKITAIPYETMTYGAWKSAKKKRARSRQEKDEKWYVVANAPEPFMPVNTRTVKRYLHGSAWWKS
jgi:hypothetical protein